jgi:hypothetical protein
MDYSSLMLKKEKIPIPKQSRFKGSDRFYRAQILKSLLTSHQASFSQLQAVFHKNHPVSPDRLEKILTGLVKEGFLVREKQKYFLAKQ